MIIMNAPFSISVKQFLFAAIILPSICLCYGNTCISGEGKALMKLKNSLIDPSNRLASWDSRTDCCSWFGVICGNFSGHVLELHLQTTRDFWERSRFGLGGMVSESLLELKHLNYLDLSNNNFNATPVPDFFGFMTSLRYLNLSASGFEGLIPRQLGNLSNLQYLDLSSVDLSKAFDWLETLGKLPSLEQLRLSDCKLTQIPPVSNVSFSSLSVFDLSYNNFYGLSVPGWISSLTSMVDLDLSNNGFSGNIPSLLQNLTSLRRLDLSNNLFSSSLPNWLGGFTRLVLLDLSRNEFQGKVPSAIGNLTSLNTLDMSSNFFEGGIPTSFEKLCSLVSLSVSGTEMSQEINEVIEILSQCASDKLESLDLSNSRFSGYLPNLLGKFKNLVSVVLFDNLIAGSIPVSVGEMASLTYLDLSFNDLNGTIPLSFGGLEKLESFYVSSNALNGEVSEFHFEYLTSLRNFDASDNNLILNVNSNWLPPFRHVEILYLRSWDVGSNFPTWIQYLNHLRYLDLSNSGISSTLPTWFHNFSSTLYQFNLSHNHMYGMIHNLSNDDSDYSFIDLSSNYFDGPLPSMSSSPGGIDLSHNFFSGSLHSFLCNKMHKHGFLYLSTEVLVLKENLLHGEIPDCWIYWTSLSVVELSNNDFSGNIPASIGSLIDLKMLNLRNNNLIGYIPSSLQDCTSLTILDLGENHLRGEIPSWIGELLGKLNILNIRGNKFHGRMSTKLCNLSYLQILDVAANNLSGSIPTCVGNWSGMFEETGYQEGRFSWAYGPRIEYMGSSSIMRKGTMVEYSTILNFVRSLDLSGNNFVGEIPEEITSLSGLQSLNLSYNSLTGRIPKNIGAIKALESLDVSENQLFGEIPGSMSTMNFLSSLNLSYNNLSGPIPSSTQLQSLDASSFIGNNLCGLPLDKKCDTSEASPRSSTEGREGPSSEAGKVDWFYFYVSLAPGFVVGFWCVMGPIVFNRQWRISYFNFLQLLWDKIWVWFHLHN